MTDLLKRIERLEQQNRRLKLVGGSLLAGVASLALMGAAATVCDTVWAERFVLNDSSGKKRMMLDAYSTGTPTVSFYDRGGKALAQLAVDSNGGARLDLISGKQKTTSVLKLSAEGSPYWESAGGAGKTKQKAGSEYEKKGASSIQ